MCAFGGDLHSTSSTSPTLWRDAGNNRVSAHFSPSAVSVRRATDPNHGHRSVVVNMGGSSGQFADIAVRGTGLDAQHANMCYLLRLQHNSGPNTWTATIQTDFATVVATADVTAIAGIGLSSNMTLELEVANVGGPNPSVGTPQITAKIMGTLPSWGGLATGFSLSSGALLDGRSAAILTGAEELFRTQSSTTMTFDTWTDLVSASGTGNQGVPPDNLVGIAVTTETGAKTGSFTVPYDWDIDRVASYRAALHPFESGHSNRILQSVRRRRAWAVKMSAATDSEIASFQSFWDSHRGVEVPFDFTTPESEVVPAHFSKPEDPNATFGPGCHHTEFEIEELFAS
jgi:hypothetical protein